MLPHIEKEILEFLTRKEKDYATVKQIVDGISTASRRQLGLAKKLTVTDIVNKLTPYLGESLQVYKGARSTYIGYKQSWEEMILNALEQKPGLSSKQLARNLPMLKKIYLTALNGLLESGSIICTFKENYTDSLKISHKTPILVEPKKELIDDRMAFKQAYDQVGKGRSFIRIHRIREYLNWPRERFDRVLTELMMDYTIELHGGDPSTMTETEIKNSFVDENGMLYVTLSWRGEP